MSFIKKNFDTTPVVDTVFTIVKKAKEAKAKYGDDRVIDASIGSLYDESNKIVAMHSVFETYNLIDDRIKASYAAGFLGNDNFRKQVTSWVLDGSGCTLLSRVIATPGGTGAVNLTIQSMLDTNETLLIPSIAWGSYKVMANNSNILVEEYELFSDDHFNMADFMKKSQNIMDKQKKLCVVINDPCHNPTGYSLSYGEWKDIINFLNTLSKSGEVIILNDIAYIDYSYDLNNVNKYMENFNHISDNILIVIAFSTSKTLTSYGLRCGGALILSKLEATVQVVENVFGKSSRALFSNVNNSAMENFVRVTTLNKEAFLNEKKAYINLLKQRSAIFIKESKECGLEIYPYMEGFFITIKMNDNSIRDKYHEKLMENLIFTVKVNHGIRIAICSLSVKKCTGLAAIMKEHLLAIKN